MILGLMFGLLPAVLISNVYFVPLPLALYLSSVSVAHLFEYLFVCGYHCDELCWDSFLINYSTDYKIAHCFALFEYLIEYHYVPSEYKVISLAFPVVGFVMVVTGHFLRIAAMFTAARNFHHVVQEKKSKTHVLVTSGVYRFVRHPSYLGWTIWAVGTQVMLANPICIVAFIFASLKFF